MATATCMTVSGAELATGTVAWAGSIASRKKVNWIPPAHVPVLEANGRFTQPWYLFFREIADVRLGGIEARTVPEIVTVQDQTQEQVVFAQSQAQTAIVSAVSIVDAVNTTKQVLTNNSISGSSTIPTLTAPRPAGTFVQ